VKIVSLLSQVISKLNQYDKPKLERINEERGGRKSC